MINQLYPLNWSLQSTFNNSILVFMSSFLRSQTKNFCFFGYFSLNSKNFNYQKSIVMNKILCVCVYLLVVKTSWNPVQIWPLQLMWRCKIAFSKMSRNICDCKELVVKCQMQCTIEENSIRNWQQRTLDAVDSVVMLTKGTDPNQTKVERVEYR